jgi:hypothetical protein
MDKIYTGIGARDTPMAGIKAMHDFGQALAQHGFILRSGAAGGADTAFESGCDIHQGKKEIYLPWPKFNNHPSSLYEISDKAMEIASEFHPNWNACSDGAKKMMARNVYQVTGLDLSTKSDFVICWTKDGKASGGTGQAIRMAEFLGIPVYNLKNQTKDEIGELIYVKLQLENA